MDFGHGGRYIGGSLVDMDDETRPWWLVDMYKISLGGIIMCMGHEYVIE